MDVTFIQTNKPPPICKDRKFAYYHTPSGIVYCYGEHITKYLGTYKSFIAFIENDLDIDIIYLHVFAVKSIHFSSNIDYNTITQNIEKIKFILDKFPFTTMPMHINSQENLLNALQLSTIISNVNTIWINYLINGLALIKLIFAYPSCNIIVLQISYNEYVNAAIHKYGIKIKSIVIDNLPFEPLYYDNLADTKFHISDKLLYTLLITRQYEKIYHICRSIGKSSISLPDSYNALVLVNEYNNMNAKFIEAEALLM